MQNNANFLCEIGTEEIPAGYIPLIIKDLENFFKQKLKENRINFSQIEAFATPRRLVVFGYDIAASQSEDEIEIKGPSVKAAYNDKGETTKALSGFISGNKILKENIFTRKTEKGEYIFAIKKLVSKKSEEIIPGIIEFIIKNIGTPKKMRWSNKTTAFPRPISYLLLIFDDKVLPFEVDGIKSSNKSRGHFIQHNKMIEINNIRDFESILLQNGIILNNIKRKEHILQELRKAADNIGGQLIEDAELLDTVTFLVENPYIVKCDFTKDFLKIPDIVLITEMKEHQKYFAVKNKNGKLMPNFLVVSNNPPTDYIKKGNERVIGARFNDASFFFNEDRKTKLIDKAEALKNVLFHKELGTIYDKIIRMSGIAEYISQALNLDEKTLQKIKRAILLSKADLVTSMVFEFSSLQGKMGRIYALLDGEDEDTADAIDDHYKPRFQDDELPVNIVSIIVSIAEKLDNIFGAFSVGNIPKGSEDPYALKRQANAIINILIKNELHVSLSDILNQISSRYKDGKAHITKILDFVTARAKTIFQENGYRYDEIDACLSIGYFDFFELFKRAASIHEFRKNEKFSEMLLSFKRMNNILNIFMEKNPAHDFNFNQKKLKEKSENDLYDFFDSRKTKVAEFIRLNNYTNLFSLLIEGKIIIDNFFNNVMVMAEEIELRDNRLALLKSILDPFKNLLDFSKISD
ncbi:MAG: glycine--tRNA ligase subunit beta [Spirochaetes bacterium]|nr:glycine--tRNA ligase subunit beta [Spirochaetota bacterium]